MGHLRYGRWQAWRIRTGDARLRKWRPRDSAKRASAAKQEQDGGAAGRVSAKPLDADGRNWCRRSRRSTDLHYALCCSATVRTVRTSSLLRKQARFKTGALALRRGGDRRPPQGTGRLQDGTSRNGETVPSDARAARRIVPRAAPVSPRWTLWTGPAVPSDEERDAQRGGAISWKPHSKRLTRVLWVPFPYVPFATSPCGWRVLGAQVTTVPVFT